MNKQEMIQHMCNYYLSDTDIKAIAKNRGFSATETKNRQIFQNYFLSDIGLKKAMASLTQKEQIFLHFLSYQEKEQDISVFERLYSVHNPGDIFQTTTQKYKGTFKQIQKNLIRKGVLLFVEKSQFLSAANAKMDRLRFAFPDEFVPFLSPLLAETVSFEKPGDHGVDIVRQMLENLAKATNEDDCIHLQDHQLKIGNNLFTLNNINTMKFNIWGKKVFEIEKLYPLAKEFLDKCRHVFSQLNSNMWFLPKDLKPIIDIFCYKEKLPKINDICQYAWESGLLKKYTHQNATYYAVEEDMDDSDRAPDEFIEISKDQSILINMNTIPCNDLIVISKVSDFDLNQSSLKASPNLIKAGQHWQHISNQPIFAWLTENSDSYRQMSQSIEKKRGQCLVHKNLCVARIKDLSLRVKVEKALSGNFKVLSDEYIAFPIAFKSEIETVVTKSGYAVKRYQEKEQL
jgi:hypothetical protein